MYSSVQPSVGEIHPGCCLQLEFLHLHFPVAVTHPLSACTTTYFPILPQIGTQGIVVWIYHNTITHHTLMHYTHVFVPLGYRSRSRITDFLAPYILYILYILYIIQLYQMMPNCCFKKISQFVLGHQHVKASPKLQLKSIFKCDLQCCLLCTPR